MISLPFNVKFSNDLNEVSKLMSTNDVLSGTLLSDGGTGARLNHIIILLCGLATAFATICTAVSVWFQLKNYRKPLLQRYVVRILLIVPIYSIASFTELTSNRLANWIVPVREIYEAFTIYTFFHLLINYCGGERAIIVSMYGKPPVSHMWPLNYVLPKVDISDPHTFLAIKRGILQYTWMKPVLALATIIMKAMGIFKSGFTGVTSGYFWSALFYNISITICLYALTLFWLCMNDQLQPFRPMSKFLCIKGIIFASYWQGLILSLLVWIGVLPDNSADYTPANLAAAVQDALVCLEMPFFALAHWYAFSWHDYANKQISAARMPIKYAIRDAFGTADLLQDTLDTWHGLNYQYRNFDAEDTGLAHEESSSRNARFIAGMRFGRNRGKYWLPEPCSSSGQPPLLSSAHSSNGEQDELNNEVMNYGTMDNQEIFTLDPLDEELYSSARALEFGDWNYPVITAQTSKKYDILRYSQRNLSDEIVIHAAGHQQSRRRQRRMKTKKLSSVEIECDSAMNTPKSVMQLEGNCQQPSSFTQLTSDIASSQNGVSRNILMQETNASTPEPSKQRRETSNNPPQLSLNTRIVCVKPSSPFPLPFSSATPPRRPSVVISSDLPDGKKSESPDVSRSSTPTNPWEELD